MIKEEKKSTFGKFSVKELVFLVISGALFVAQGYSWMNLIINGVINREPIDYVLPIVLTVGFCSIFALTSIFATASWLVWLILSVASFAAVFLIPVWLGSYIAATLVAAALLYAMYNTRSAYANLINFNTGHVIKTCLSGTFTAIVFLMSFYYLHIQLTRPISIIPTGLIENVVSFTSGIFGKQLQEQIPLSSGQEKSISLEGLPPEIQNLIPSNLRDIRDIFGGSKPAQSKSSNVTRQIAGTIEAQVDKLIEPYKPFLPYVFTALFFLSVRGVMFILGWIVVPLTAVALKFLIAVDLAHKEKVQIEAERVFF